MGDAVFRWDEDWKYGSHYHIEGNPLYKGHYWPLMSVPEPYATLYFDKGKK